MNNSHSNISLITDNDLCVSCGACSHQCFHGAIEMKLNDHRGKWQPVIRNLECCEKCNGERGCLSVCPAWNVDYMKLAESEQNGMLGRIERVCNGYSGSVDIRRRASSGGFIRHLCQSLLDREEIDGIITLSHDGGLEYTPKVLTEVDQMPTSIYHNINFANAIKMLKQHEGRYLIIGLPCQITSIELFVRKKRNRYLTDRIYAKVALFCSYLHDRNALKAVAYYNNFDFSEITYRGNGRDLMIRMKNSLGEVREINSFYPKNVHELMCSRLMYENFFLQYGCAWCVDHLGYCADIVAGDSWLARYRQDRSGTNLIICRTAWGEQLVEQVQGMIFLEGSIDDILKSQGVAYALAGVAEGMKHISVKGQSFQPEKIRSDHQHAAPRHDFTWKDRFKLKVIKRALTDHGHFKTARLLYFLLELPLLVKFALGRFPDGYIPPFLRIGKDIRMLYKAREISNDEKQ